MKASIDILNNKTNVEVANPFRVSMMEVLENDKKRMQWLLMLKIVQLSWMTRQVEKMQ